MNKRGFLSAFLLIVLGLSNGYGMDIFHQTIVYAIHITDTKMTVEIYGFNDETAAIEEYEVTWETIDKVRYLNFYYNGTFLSPYRGPKTAHGMKRYLVVHGSWFLFFYNENNQLEFNSEGGKGLVDGSDITAISASSELRENNYTYAAENLYNRSVLTPWAEGVSGSGIGERIRIEVEQSRRNQRGSDIIRSLSISNGFVDYNRPHLYENNNRIKKIRVHNIGYDEYADFDVEDASDIQFFGFGFSNPPYIIEIEILEIYKGSRWDDTCINLIIPFVA